MGAMERHIGIEQELFLVDVEGAPADRADEFLARCREMEEQVSSLRRERLKKLERETEKA